MGVVSALSTPSLAFNDFRPDMVVWPIPRGSDCPRKSTGPWRCSYLG